MFKCESGWFEPIVMACSTAEKIPLIGDECVCKWGLYLGSGEADMSLVVCMLYNLEAQLFLVLHSMVDPVPHPSMLFKTPIIRFS